MVKFQQKLNGNVIASTLQFDWLYITDVESIFKLKLQPIAFLS